MTPQDAMIAIAARPETRLGAAAWAAFTACLAAQEAGGTPDDNAQIVAAFVAQHGQAVLAVPEDRGFNRLAWVFPYALAAAGLITIIVNARRWSHRPARAAASGESTSPTADPALDARLDDELRDLD